MIKKIAQNITVNENGDQVLEYDWYPMAIPKNIVLEDNSYPDTMYSFSSFYSTESAAFFLDFASGNYGHSNFLTGLRGKIKVGKYVILEATNLICTGSIEINDHCMFSWGSVVMDSMLSPQKRDIIERRKLLEEAANSDIRFMEYNFLKPVIIEENVWVGFGAVIMPGVKLGKGCIIGCKTIVYDDVPPYAVVVGQPPRIIRYLTPAKKS